MTRLKTLPQKKGEIHFYRRDVIPLCTTALTIMRISRMALDEEGHLGVYDICHRLLHDFFTKMMKHFQISGQNGIRDFSIFYKDVCRDMVV